MKNSFLSALVIGCLLVVVTTVPAIAQAPRNFWAYAQMNVNPGGDVSVPLARVRGFAQFQGRVIAAEYDFVATQLKVASVTDTIIPGALVTAGAFCTPAGGLFPGPHEAFFSSPPETKITPPLFDVGGTTSFKRDAMTLTAGLLSGEGPGKVARTPTPDVILSAKFEHSGLKLIVLAQSGERVSGKIRRYGAVQCEYKHSWLTLGAGYAKRYDLADKSEGAHVELRADLGLIEVGVRGEKPDRITAAAFRPLGWKTGLAVETNLEKHQHAYWSAGLQYAIDFLKL